MIAGQGEKSYQRKLNGLRGKIKQTGYLTLQSQTHLKANVTKKINFSHKTKLLMV